MPKKNSLIVIGVAILIIIGITLWKQGVMLGSIGDNDYMMSSDDVSGEPRANSVVKNTATKAVVSPYKQVRVFEKGGYVNIVNLTNTGFVPKVVEVNRGETVRFVNKSGSAMRIASDQDNGVPLYIALNQEKSVGQNGIYELTLSEPGIWVYNNLSNPLGIGVVYVK